MVTLGNFVKIDRKILKWEWWDDINTFRLFMYMLLAAYWKDGKYKGQDIPRGSFPSSLSELSRETSLTENEVRTAITHLKRTGEITVKPHARFSVFTVKNYDTYQTDNTQNHEQTTDKPQTDNTQTTGKSHPINSLLTGYILKEDKNIQEEKEGKKDIDAAGFAMFWEAYPKKVRRQEAETAYCDLLLSGTVTPEELHAAALNYAEACRIEGTDKVYHPHNFLAKCAFEDYLPGRYNRPEKKPDAKNQFCSFPQRERSREELEELEAALLGRGTGW